MQFTTDVNVAQARYEATGRYEHQSFQQVYEQHYSRDDQMNGYLWGVYLTNFLWAHHMQIVLFFQDRFVTSLPQDARIIEIAPGHGGWGLWALSVKPDASLQGFDISPSSIEIASSVARAAGFSDRATYKEADALDLPPPLDGTGDGCICSFLLEHLERPDKCFAAIARVMRQGAHAFVTGALTAAQIDHIYEFRKESELVVMAEDSGLRVVEALSANPSRLLPRAQFVPRSMAMIVEKTGVTNS